MSAFFALLKRECRLAFRARADVAAQLLFALLVVSLFPLALGPAPEALQKLSAGLLSLALLLTQFLGFDRLFSEDAEAGTLDLLPNSGLSFLGYAFGKILARWVTHALPLLLATPLLALLLNAAPDKYPAILAALFLTSLSLNLVGGALAALTLGARRGFLLPLLLGPLSVPVLIFCVALAEQGFTLPAGHQAALFLGSLFFLYLCLAPLFNSGGFAFRGGSLMKTLNNPSAFRVFAKWALPLSSTLAVLLLVPALYLALGASPPDYQQGETVRIMYLHVPAASGSLLLYLLLGIAAFVAFIWKHALADVFCAAASPAGATLAALCLITGSLWGKPMWGAWWVWDARLTSMLVLFFFYLGAVVLRGAFGDAGRGAKASQILLILGLINLPIVKFSVDWWNTLHQGASLLRKDGPTIAEPMLIPLLVATAAGFFLCTAIILMRMLTRLRRKM